MVYRQTIPFGALARALLLTSLAEGPVFSVWASMLVEPIARDIAEKNPDAIMLAFIDAVTGRGLELYPAQEEAILELMAGKNVILNTPTGSGKSLIASMLHYKGLCEGKRSFYTCPIKALVSEKFFALARDFGAQNVGMITGDASINRDAPIICCTAEILSNMALYEGATAKVDYVIMDEFHYYSDKDRGMAWQLPLLTLPQCTFLLMSATLGDAQNIVDSLKSLTGKDVAWVRSAERPVPLDYQYRETPLHETLVDLVRTGKSPVYVVNFTQRESIEEAQNALSVDFCDKAEKQAIAQALQGFRFDSPFGKDMRRFVLHGIGVHHAGLLPKYRLLVEKLAQDGLLKIIMGTDTLGVGVNVPIRTVLFTKLCKFDGEKTGILTVRDFKQIAGRAGRKGFDTQGSVVCQAPEHVIENKRQENRAMGNPAKMKKLVKQKPPTKNYVPWDASTFERLIHDNPEMLQSRFAITHGMILNVLQGHCGGQGMRHLYAIIAKSHERPTLKTRHRRHAKLLFKSLRRAGIINIVRNRQTGNRVTVHENLQTDFSLNQTLSLYLIDTLGLLDPQSPSYALDVLTLVEAILENPHAVLQKQVDVLKTERMAQLKAEGVEYEQRIEELDKVEHPKPNRDFIYETFNAYSEKHPWIGAENIQPKSIAREIFERCMSFHEYIREYSLQRSEGVLLRYLSQVYKTLIQTIPQDYKNDEIQEIAIFFRSLLGHADTSLVEEWENILSPPTAADAAPVPTRRAALLFDPKTNFRAFAARVRAEMHQIVKALARNDYEAAVELLQNDASEGWTPERLHHELTPFLNEYGNVDITPRARQPQFTLIKQQGDQDWRVQQILVDKKDDNLWMLDGVITVTPDTNFDGPIFTLTHVGT